MTGKPILKSGCLAYLDTMQYGLVKVKVLEVSSTFCTVQTTQAKWSGGSLFAVKGAILKYWSHCRVVPRDAVFGLYRMSGPRIMPYRVEVDGRLR